MSASGHNVDGVQSYQLGNYQRAIDSFQRALASNPNNADAYYNLAAVYHQAGQKSLDQGMLEQAEGLYHQCLDRSPDHADCHRGLASLLVQTERAQSAFTLLERWAQRSPQRADPRIELARLHEEFGDKDVAGRHLAEALDVEPRNARAWTALGNLREQQGQLAQALSNYRQANRLNGYQPGVANRIAALEHRISVTPGGSPPGDTRMVRTPNETTR